MTIILLLMTIVSTATAAVALAVVRRTIAAERRRSDARVVALAAAAETHPGDGRPWTPRADTASCDAAGRERLTSPVKDAVASDWQDRTSAGRQILFETVRRPDRAPIRFGLAVAVVLLFVAVAAMSVFAVRGGHDQAARPAAGARQPRPLELVALRHSHELHTLIISGTVRNPSTGAKLDELTAVISLLDRNGALVATKDVPLDYRALGPGEEAPFTLRVPDQPGIDRYRVSFRAGTEIIPHVDRRSNAKMTTPTA